MVDQRRSQASVNQPKYDTYAKPVLLSQPEKQRASVQPSSESPDNAAATETGTRKFTPGKLDLSKIRSLSQGDLKAIPGPAIVLLPPRKLPQNAGPGAADTDSTGKENLLSPGRLDLPNGTPLSRHPSDALNQKTFPKAQLEGDGVPQGQITIVAEALAQYEEKILQGQRQRKGRFSGSSTPDVSRHASVCSSEHATPRETPPQPSSGVPCSAAEPHSNGSARQGSRTPDAPTAAAGMPSADRHSQVVPDVQQKRGLEQGTQQSSSSIAFRREGVSAEASPAARTARISEGTDEDEAAFAEPDQAGTPKPENGDRSASAPGPAASRGKASESAQVTVHSQQRAETEYQDAHVLPVSTCASPGADAEPEPRRRPHRGAAAAGKSTGRGSAVPAAPPMRSRGAVEGDQTTPSSAGGVHGGEGTPSEARARQEIHSGNALSAERAPEPEWVAAFRRVVSLAVDTPLSQLPAPRDVASTDNAQPSDGVPGPAPSPSSELGASGDLRAGGNGGLFGRYGSGGGRSLDTAFESALTDSRHKRQPAEASAHGSGAGSVVRAAAAVQRAAERAALDRNDYSGARISEEGAPVLSPGAIALVNGRTVRSEAQLQAQLSDVVHQLRFCLASLSEQQRPLLHATEILQAAKVPRRELMEAAEKLQEAERLRRWSEVAQSENIARLLSILGEMQAVQQARAEDVHFSASVWLKLLNTCQPAAGSRPEAAEAMDARTSQDRRQGDCWRP